MGFESLNIGLLAGLALASLAAGLIDAMAGGGGLIQIPALFTLFPQTLPATLLGTNKFAGIVGTTNAAYRYARVVALPWNAVLPATAAALIFAHLGSMAVAHVSAGVLRLLLPVLLLAVAVFTFVNKNLGSVHAPRLTPLTERWVGLLTGAGIGFYDGFFGPGTGSFLMVAFVVLFGFDFLVASAGAKFVNIACNLASLAWFVPAENVLWAAAIWMAMWNFIGSLIGSRLAIVRGASFVRKILLLVVGALILKTAWDAYSPFFV
ncbi:MAG: TSUP family transporter [Burkholderiaceae bacterium]|jgi:uncharacterized membrane protein YfcA